MQTPTDKPNILNDIPSNSELAAIRVIHEPESIAEIILRDAKITQLPVNLYQIADSLKITVSENKNFEGVNSDNEIIKGYVTEMNKDIILNPEFDNPRFALSLLLGDIVCRNIIANYFRWSKNQYNWIRTLIAFGNDMSPKQFTKLQEHIAIAILMPKQQFIEKYNSGEPYENIAADFDVTDVELRYRLNTLGL